MRQVTWLLDANRTDFPCDLALQFGLIYITSWLSAHYKSLKNSTYLERSCRSVPMRKSDNDYCKVTWRKLTYNSLHRVLRHRGMRNSCRNKSAKCSISMFWALRTTVSQLSEYHEKSSNQCHVIERRDTDWKTNSQECFHCYSMAVFPNMTEDSTFRYILRPILQQQHPRLSPP